MRKMLLIASAVTVVAATGAYAIRSTPTTAAPEVAPSTSVLEMMSTAKDLPVAPTPDAF
jgi:hypothetical protein